jgi:hypothetical protein
MSTETSRRDDHYYFVLKNAFDKALPQGSAQRLAVQAELDNITGQTWNDPDIARIAELVRRAIP